MIRILTVVGARPQFIKSAAISRVIRGEFSDRVEEQILHTGQHYDQNMSAVFFEELGIPQPHFQLHVGSGRHGEQTAKMIEGIEDVLTREDFDGVLVYGDTNSTLAGALVASKLRLPLFHVEAGLRSFNMSMPEEINRIVCDQLSSILFAPTETAVQNLQSEGFFTRQVTFANGKRQEVYLSGDIMLDNSLHYAKVAAERTDIIVRNGLQKADYLLATIHRDLNTDDPARLTAIFHAIVDVAETHRLRVVLPLHPRTAKLMHQQVEYDVLWRFTNSPYITILPPASFFEMIELEQNARLVLTDSGGVQKEAFFFGKPSVILRPETEWTEIVTYQAGLLADADYVRILSACDTLLNTRFEFPPLFGDGHAARFILEKMVAYL